MAAGEGHHAVVLQQHLVDLVAVARAQLGVGAWTVHRQLQRGRGQLVDGEALHVDPGPGVDPLAVDHAVRDGRPKPDADHGVQDEVAREGVLAVVARLDEGIDALGLRHRRGRGQVGLGVGVHHGEGHPRRHRDGHVHRGVPGEGALRERRRKQQGHGFLNIGKWGMPSSSPSAPHTT